MRRRAPPIVAWLKSTSGQTRFCSVISIGEITKGIEKRRKSDEPLAARLAVWLRDLEMEFGERVLPITTEIAVAWGRIASGRTRDTADSLIAATAIVHDLTLVTRNTRDFADLSIKLYDPWSA
ncbi:type II toxin-antitoxin system VapC family toxin [Terrarubrum flagellatum]|uniref:type II toxin-antitoxin system VapC family toxin n=1 Tax=Terrirubrum flagellatum TaxID=2895980 RepID=UPI003144E3A3